MNVPTAYLLAFLLAFDCSVGADYSKFFYGLPNEMHSIKDRVSKNRFKRTVAELSQRVVGGIAAEENKFPWIVYFHAISKKRRNGSDEYGSVTNFCGGSLIHSR